MILLTTLLVAQTLSAGGLSFKAPQGWASEPNPSNMRVATFKLPATPGDANDGELAIFFFGQQQGGSTEANVQRWINQFTPEAKSPQPTMKIEKVNGVQVTRVTVEGTYASGMPGQPTTPKTGYALLGAIAQGPSGNVFFKLTGPKKSVQKAKPQFEALIKSVRSVS